jgi:ABC-type Mn2+/Zn2+ transport system permease subunit
MGYFERALLEAVLAGGLAGLVGTLVVLRRRAFFTTALTHATFPGGVAAAIIGVPVALGAAAMSVVLVALMTALGRVRGQGAQIASGIVLTFGFALGVLLQSLFPSLPVDIDSYLVGSILTTTTADLVLTAIVFAIAAGVLVVAGKEIVFDSFDRDGYRAAGYRGWVPELLSLLLIAATVVTIMPAVGSILAIALIVAPAAAARAVTRSIGGTLLLAPLLGMVAGVAGLYASSLFAISAGAAISLAAALVFLVALLGAQARRSVRKRRTAPAVSIEAT